MPAASAGERFGQADEDGFRRPGGDVDFRLDGGGLDADEGEGGQLGPQAPLRSTARAAATVFLIISTPG